MQDNPYRLELHLPMFFRARHMHYVLRGMSFCGRRLEEISPTIVHDAAA